MKEGDKKYLVRRSLGGNPSSDNVYYEYFGVVDVGRRGFTTKKIDAMIFDTENDARAYASDGCEVVEAWLVFGN